MEQVEFKPVSYPHDSIEVAECLLKVADEQETSYPIDQSGTQDKDGVTNLKLQKLLFFAQAAHLALFDKPLINEEFEAWNLGPVLRSVYDKYKTAGREVIEPPSDFSCLDQNLKKFLEEVWKVFGKYTASELVHLSHREGTPWQIHYNPSGQSERIPNDEIKDYYKKFFQIPN